MDTLSHEPRSASWASPTHFSHGGKISTLHVGTGLTSNSRRSFPDSTAVKNLPAVQEMQFRSLGGEDPLENEMATHSSILAWKIPRAEEPGGLASMES